MTRVRNWNSLDNWQIDCLLIVAIPPTPNGYRVDRGLSYQLAWLRLACGERISNRNVVVEGLHLSTRSYFP